MLTKQDEAKQFGSNNSSSMRIFIKVKSRSYQEKVEKIDKNHFVVWVKEPPAKGLANKGVVKVLADYFGVSQYDVRLVSGFTSSNKLVEIKKI